jgi:hypothetical protein
MRDPLIPLRYNDLDCVGTKHSTHFLKQRCPKHVPVKNFHADDLSIENVKTQVATFTIKRNGFSPESPSAFVFRPAIDGLNNRLVIFHLKVFVELFLTDGV